MTLQFLIAPDFSPERFAGWHMLNTTLQRRSGIHLHLVTPASAHEQLEVLAAGQTDLVYANPFDAVDMIRTQGYQPFARPAKRFDEMVIATAMTSGIHAIEDLKPGCRIALTENRDVKLIGLRLLEPADVTEAQVVWSTVDSYQAAARKALKGEVDAAFFLADAYASFSKMTRSQLHVLVESAIHDISHVLLAHPRMAADLPVIEKAFLELGQMPGDTEVLEALGLVDGFEAMDQEQAEFMIDLMDTLLD
ncbi:phosphate/phosphite/phosphonate ABC transporter substrate-binding protein [Rhodoferax sp.]|uniref:phosphate/phosphite/phosphonate ABC transporter substrate-binding protein n=1 Tax=Rhodoferax sp. TaxID=50421 RepID=UPI002602CD85|nr:phosphate/phosphite/phosphonate ABC transporter substrate-binding protein [Rhodoferax sp.]MDD2808755.1 phosphate/phosphite/phosphonate ABC transporter substrate-binding protein [Rhodoferax sp.]